MIYQDHMIKIVGFYKLFQSIYFKVIERRNIKLTYKSLEITW